MYRPNVFRDFLRFLGAKQEQDLMRFTNTCKILENVTSCFTSSKTVDEQTSAYTVKDLVIEVVGKISWEAFHTQQIIPNARYSSDHATGLWSVRISQFFGSSAEIIENKMEQLASA